MTSSGDTWSYSTVFHIGIHMLHRSFFKKQSLSSQNLENNNNEKQLTFFPPHELEENFIEILDKSHNTSNYSSREFAHSGQLDRTTQSNQIGQVKTLGNKLLFSSINSAQNVIACVWTQRQISQGKHLSVCDPVVVTTHVFEWIGSCWKGNVKYCMSQGL